MLAGTDESPGQYFYQDGVRLKKYRGMGSVEAMNKRSGRRYMTEGGGIQVSQGVSGTVVGKGSVSKLLSYLSKGVCHGFQDLGLWDIVSTHRKLSAQELMMEVRSSEAQREGGVHGLFGYDK